MVAPAQGRALHNRRARAPHRLAGAARGGDTTQLTTYSATTGGARGIYDVLARLGWQVSRRTTRLDGALDTGAVYAILAPPIPLDSTERMTLLQTVRAGGRVLIVSQDTQFTTHFRMHAVYAPGRTAPIEETSAAGDGANVMHRDPPESFGLPVFVASGWMPPQFVVEAEPPTDYDTAAVLLWASHNRYDSASAAPLVLGRRLGKGRVVLVGDPSLLWNATVQEGHSALAILRAIEWLAPSNRKVIFDEYHHGRGYKGVDYNMPGAIVQALTGTAAGRAGIQLLIAALVLLIALGVRPIPPRPVLTIQRRSLLEHVDALGRAYQQINALQFGTQQLMRGLRRRHPTGAAVAQGTTFSDTEYLASVQHRYGIAQRDIETISRVLQGDSNTPSSDTVSAPAAVRDELFIQAGRAVASIEHSMHIQ